MLPPRASGSSCARWDRRSSRPAPHCPLLPALPWTLAAPSSLLSSKEHTGAWLPAWEEVAQTSSWEDGVTTQDIELCLVTLAHTPSLPWRHRGGHGTLGAPELTGG